MLAKSCKSIFYVLSVNCYCTYIFKSSNNRFSGVLIRTYFKSSYFFLWFHYWILKERKTAKVENHSVSAYYLFTQMIGPLFGILAGTMFIFSSVRFLNMCKPRTGLPTSTRILWKWASKPAELAEDGECRLIRFHPIRNFLGNEIYLFSRLSHQTGCLFTWAARSK